MRATLVSPLEENARKLVKLRGRTRRAGKSGLGTAPVVLEGPIERDVLRGVMRLPYGDDKEKLWRGLDPISKGKALERMG